MEIPCREEPTEDLQVIQTNSQKINRHNFADETHQVFREISADISRYPRSRSWLNNNADDSLARQFGDQVTKEIMTFLASNPDSKVLDVGSGNSSGLGSLCQLFGANIKRASGIDLQPQNHTPFDLDLHEGDVACMPFKDNEFDLIYSAQVFKYVADKLKGLREIFRVQKPHSLTYVQFYPDSIVPFRSYEDFLAKNRSNIQEVGRELKYRYALLRLKKENPDEQLIIPTLHKINVWPGTVNNPFKIVTSFYN